MRARVSPPKQFPYGAWKPAHCDHDVTKRLMDTTIEEARTRHGKPNPKPVRGIRSQRLVPRSNRANGVAHGVARRFIDTVPTKQRTLGVGEREEAVRLTGDSTIPPGCEMKRLVSTHDVETRRAALNGSCGHVPPQGMQPRASIARRVTVMPPVLQQDLIEVVHGKVLCRAKPKVVILSGEQ